MEYIIYDEEGNEVAVIVQDGGYFSISTADGYDVESVEK